MGPVSAFRNSFHDSAERVATAFADDARQLARAGHAVTIEMQLPGYIRATVASDGGSTKVEWAHDSAWRFLPTVRHDVVGFVLHPIDLASHVIDDPDHGDPGIRVAAATELPARPTRRARVQTAGADPHHRARVAQG